MARERKKTGGESGAAAHRWAIDRVEEGTAAVEQDGDHVYEIPRFLVPDGARDGDVLAVTVTPGPRDAVTVTVRIDRAAGDDAKKKSSLRRPAKDSGGDIVL
jgi:hypothetical protein